MRSTTRRHVFISFAHADAVHCNRIVDMYARRAPSIPLWHYTGAAPGTAWTDDLRNAIANTDLAILLLTQSFLSSEFIQDDELPELLARQWEEGVRLIPFLMEPCAYEEHPILSNQRLYPGRTPLSGFDSAEQERWLEHLVAWTAELLGAPRLASRAAYVPPHAVDTSRLPITSGSLLGRRKELLMLDASWSSFQVNAACVVGAGGEGKSSLVQRWLGQLAEEEYRSARRVFGWSFHSHGSAAGVVNTDEFFDEALRWFGVPEPFPVLPWARAGLLAEAIQAQRSLVVLDGLEVLQIPVGHQAGTLLDLGLEFLIAALARENPGLLLLTSRIAPVFPDRTERSLVHIELGGLSQVDAAELCRSLGIAGSAADHAGAARELHGHALSLTLLAPLVARSGRSVTDLLSGVAPAQSPHERVLESLAEVLEPDESLWLGLLGLFDRPAEQAEVRALEAALAAPPPSPILETLRLQRLVAPPNPARPAECDLHPLVRAHFGTRLRQHDGAAWRKANRALYAQALRTAPTAPSSANELRPLHDAIVFGSRAGCEQEVLDKVYWKALLRSERQHSWMHLGAVSSDLNAIGELFAERWTRPSSEIARSDHGFLVGQAGLYFGVLGDLGRAEESLKRSIELDLQAGNAQNAAVTAGNLAAVLYLMGQLEQSLDRAREAVKLAHGAGDTGEELIAWTHVGHALHARGETEQALEAYGCAEELFRRTQGGQWMWAGMGAELCKILIDRGREDEAIERCRHNFANAPPEIPRGPEQEALCRALLRKIRDADREALREALDAASAAVDEARSGRKIESLPPALLARGRVLAWCGSQAAAGRDYSEALELSAATGMRIHEADARLSSAERALCMGQRSLARSHLEAAERWIDAIGYRLRARELESLADRLGAAR